MIGFYVNHTSRFQRNTGIQRCVRAIARGLIELGEPTAPLVWHTQSFCFELAGAEARQHLSGWNGPSPVSWRQQLPPPGSWLVVVELISGPHQPSWQQLGAAAQRLGWRVLVIFHDSIPLGWGGAAAKFHGTYMTGLAAQDLVLANSRAAAADLEQFWRQWGLGSQRPLLVLPLAEELAGSSRQWTPGPLPKAGVPLEVLCVGSLEPRKNHRNLLKALAWLEAQQQPNSPKLLRLTLLGWANDSAVVALVERAVALGLALRWEAEADDDRLLEAYQQAAFTVYPSLLEGYGLPVAESLWLGRPCLCSGEGALAERAEGGGCLMVETRSWHALAVALKTMAEDHGLRARLQHELAHRPLRSWTAYAAELLALLGAHS